MGDGYATIPTRECEQCGTRTICRDTDDGRLCGICELVVEATGAAVRDCEDVMNVVMPLAEQGDYDIEPLMASYGAVVGGVIRYLTDHPHMLARLQRHADA